MTQQKYLARIDEDHVTMIQVQMDFWDSKTIHSCLFLSNINILTASRFLWTWDVPQSIQVDMSWQTYIYALGFLGNLLIILVGPNIHNKFVNSIFNYIKRTNCVYVKPCSTIESKCPPKIMFNLNLNCVHVYKCVGISILWTHLAYTCHMCFNVIKLTINGCSNNVHASSKVGEEFKATMGLLGE